MATQSKKVNASTGSQKITPFLWFNDNAEEAVKFYISVFKKSKIGKMTHYGKNMPGREGSVMTVPFQLEGQQFTAINGGPHFKFTEAISFYVNCKTQDEIDYFWKALSAGGEKSQCGWLKDKYGLSWQVVPESLGQMLQSGNSEKANNVMAAVLKMSKLNMKVLKQAFDKK